MVPGHRAALAAMTLLTALAVSRCSSKTTPAAGLEVIVTTSGLQAGTDFDTLEVKVQQETAPGAWHQVFDAPRRVPTEVTLPTTFAIQAGTSPDQDALVEVTALKSGAALVQRVVQVQVPTDRVAALLVVLAQACAGKVTTCSNGSCQPQTGSCGSNVVDPSTLPGYTPGDEGRVDAGSAAGGPPDGSIAADGSMSADASMAADGSTASDDASEGGMIDAGADAVLSPDAGVFQYDASSCSPFCYGKTPVCVNGTCMACAPTTAQCADMGHQGLGVQTCDSTGQWGNPTACPATAPDCSQGTCLCPSSASVTNGVCCPNGQTGCSGACVDEQTDRKNCGACGNSCFACSAGQCDSLVAVSCGGESCVLLSDGTVQCWAPNGATIAPAPEAGLSGVTAIGMGAQFGCALALGGTVQCWGDNTYGELGNGTSSTTGRGPGAVAGLSGATSIAVGQYHACALLSGGTVECWGWNTEGQLGIGTQTGPDTCAGGYCSMTPAAVPGLSGVAAIAAGSWSTCALLTDGTLQCWGWTECCGSSLVSTTPVAVPGLSGVKALSVGNNFVCVVLSDGTMQCWGNNASGQLGDGTKTNSTTPVVVAGLSGARAVATGFDGHTCALLSGGTVQCWGAGTQTISPTPVTVSGVTGATAIAAGYGNNCALVSGNQVQCWTQ